jgi:hypothetical protein
MLLPPKKAFKKYLKIQNETFILTS